MTIINHGSWSRYVPGIWPEGFPSNIMFCKRDSDGIDWYDYIYKGASFAPGSIKVTVEGGLTRAATRDESKLFPQSSVVLEITGDNAEDPQAAFGGLVYDEASNTLSLPRPTVPQSVTPRQARLALLSVGLLDQVEASVNAAGGATKITWEYATEINRRDPMIISIGSSLGLTSDQIDALFLSASEL
ncbi:hypothetical protein [Bradyrhizobium sp. sGM-13]|uniref:hypothetical protein n=1 Tax=Bradyrhizobium sp. sGM-13 TaxID=2831781 RepID=UPI001BCB7C4F|nr:hypothetical protein [Bradyrhizobium sp. sGM-13]